MMNEHEKHSDTKPSDATGTSKASNAPAYHSSWQRRTHVGLMVLIQVIVVVGIWAIGNFLVHKPDFALRDWLWHRVDLTETRQYSLSNQTRAMLENITSEMDIYSLYQPGTAQAQQVNDLLREYELRSGGKIDVHTIDPLSPDPEEYQQLLEQLEQRHAEVIAQTRQVTMQALQMLAAMQTMAQQEPERVGQALTQIPQASEETRALLEQIVEYWQIYEQAARLTEIQERLEQMIEEPLPNIAAIRQSLVTNLRQARDDFLLGFESALRQLLARGQPEDVQQVVAEIANRYRQRAEQLLQVIDRIEQIDSYDYDVFQQRVNVDSIVFVAEDRAAALPVDQVYNVSIQQNASDPDDMVQELFQGEEVISGAILGMSMEHPPLVVFANPSQAPALGPRGQFAEAAQPLINMNFEVEEWHPQGRMTPQGQMTGAQPMPEAEPGQPWILVVLPAPPPSPQMPYNPAVDMIAEALSEHLAAGHSALVFSGYVPGMMAASYAPLQAVLEPYGIKAINSQLLLTMRTMRDGEQRPTPEIAIRDWPEGDDVHPVARAMQGVHAVVVEGVPINMPEESPQNVQIWPLAETGERAWAETDPQPGAVPNEDERKGPITVAAAAKRLTDDGTASRLVLISDNRWAMNQILGASQLDPYSGRTFRMFPGNGELFVNSIFWLGNMDDLIATTARRQDVPRITNVQGATTHVRVLTLLIVPLLCLLAGVPVWLIRRR